MNNQEAKFILCAYRPDGADAVDPLFAEPLAQAQRDPELAAWLKQQQTLDARVAAALKQVEPPPGLRETILVGARADRIERAWWRSPVWVAAAAAIAFAVFLGGWWLRGRGPGSQLADFGKFAAQDLAESDSHHLGRPAALAEFLGSLENPSNHLARQVAFDPDELRKHGCRTVTFNGADVFEICFKREGAWFHIYAMPLSKSPHGGGSEAPGVREERGLAVATWTNSRTEYALVTNAAPAVLERVL